MMRAVAWVVAALWSSVATASSIPPLRLYTLDCGRIDFTDMHVFSDTGEHAGEQGAMPVTCFLIQHGKDWMLWDAGLGDEIAAFPGGQDKAGLHFRVPRTLASQLSTLGLQPDDITYVGLSHLHADHSGNAPLFPHATFLVSPAELAWASQTPPPEGVLTDRVAAVQAAKITPVPGDLDVFGDGTVQMISTPGHTPGHHALMLKMRHAGVVLLSGDVAHFQVNYDRGLVPTGNVNRADTLASIGRLHGLAAHYHARVIIQHAAGVFHQMPTLPAYLD